MNAPIELPLGDFTPDPNNPRTDITQDNIRQLAQSIALQGVLVAIIALRVSGKLQILDGHRRWHAAKMVQLPTIPAVVLDKVPNQQ